MQEYQNICLGLKANLKQFILLIIVNAFVGAMLGVERGILPVIAEIDFHITSKTLILSFIISFGIAKAITNFLAGYLSDKHGRKPILIAGWLVAVPVPFIILFAPSWAWIIFANVLLGVSQGFTWSTTVIMKIDLVGPKQRGLAMGLNEFAGYAAIAFSALVAGWISMNYGLRDPFYLGIAYVGLGLLLSTALVKETRQHVAYEGQSFHQEQSVGKLDGKEIFCKTSFKDRNLSTVSQAGLVNNLNDGMAWGLFPILFAAAGLNLKEIGVLVAIYPTIWGIAQILTGILSDYLGRKWLIVFGMWIQAMGIGVTALSDQFAGFALGGIFLGIGTAMVYPPLLAAIGDVAHPRWRASSIGVYRLWRDLGYAFGALLAGMTADLFGLSIALWMIAGITAFSGLTVMIRMQETLQKN